MIRLPIVLFLFALHITGCNVAPQEENSSDLKWEAVDLGYASGFTIHEASNLTLLTVNEPYPGAEESFRYILYPNNQPKPTIKADALIPVPIQRIVCTSTTHIPLLDYLGVSESLIGFPTTDYISSALVRKRIDKGQVTDLGVDANLNQELLLSIKPDLMMGYTMDGNLSQLERLQQAGVNIVLNSEFLEKHPLGRAEWIKFMAPFFGQETKADSIFSSIEKNYLDAKKHALEAKSRPSAFSGIMYGDTWFLPGGQNYAAKIMRDANIEYIWGADSSNGFLQLSLESVYDKANKADYWLGVGSFESLESLRMENNRYGEFQAFQNQQVYSFNKRMGEKGGVEYLELGYLRPDLILDDLIKICHPDLADSSETFFFFNLPSN